MASPGVEGSRLAPTRRRVGLAKAGFAVGAAVVFGTALTLARAHRPGHVKQRLRPLGATLEYRVAVNHNIGDSGIIQRPLSSPSTATNVS